MAEKIYTQADLEALLRRAELKGELKGLNFGRAALIASDNLFSWANKLVIRVTELEKDRALEGNG